MKSINKKVGLILIAIFIVAVLAIILIVDTNKDSINKDYTNNVSNKMSNSSLDNINQLTNNTQVYAFSDSNYYLEHTIKSDGKQILTMYDRQDNLSEMVNGTYDFNFQYRNFIWNSNKTRLWFISEIREENHYSFHYIDITAFDPLAATSISYEDPDNLIGTDVEITKVEGNILYLTSGGKELLFDTSRGPDTRPELGYYRYSLNGQTGTLSFPYSLLKIEIPVDFIKFTQADIDSLNDKSVHSVDLSCRVSYFQTQTGVGLWVSYGMQDVLCGTERFLSFLGQEPFQSNSGDFCSLLVNLPSFKYAACKPFMQVPDGYEGFSFYEFIYDYGIENSGTIVREVFIRNKDDNSKKAIFGYVPTDNNVINVKESEFDYFVRQIESGKFQIFNEEAESVKQFENIISSLQYD
ncbi:MAG: hypothetical protein WCV50_02490 [Patescibacteria group bacterium]|jgi:hypothetical protein